MRFLPKEEKFSDQFEALADKIQEGGELFLDLMINYRNVAEKVSRLKDIEHEADTITHGVFQKLHRTFITPLDREDIYALANRMDSIMDMIEASAMRMKLYRIKEPLPECRELALVLNESVALVRKVVYAMRHYKKDSKAILDMCVEINSLENEGDQLLRKSMVCLFERERNPIELIKWKEIFERIEEATDICEDVSNVIEGIILKHA
jgi:predicted phosphate transport protein (TIGR00153 family)